jgi:SOS response regulatory protein OraA/RecX
MDEYEAALAKVLRKLRAGDRFEAEIRELLTPYSPETAERVMGFVKQHRLLSDERTAENLATRRSKVGGDRLRQELESRGASTEVIEKAMPSEVEQKYRIDSLLHSRFSATGDRAKAARWLASRGFDEDAVRSAVESYFGDDS